LRNGARLGDTLTKIMLVLKRLFVPSLFSRSINLAFHFYHPFTQTISVAINVMAEEKTDFKLYRYDPSMAAAVIFIILFIIATMLHVYQIVRTRAWIFVPFCIGGVCKQRLHFARSREYD
jgi:hypothetical protein